MKAVSSLATGCLTYTAGNVFGGGGNTLIRITATPLATCME